MNKNEEILKKLKYCFTTKSSKLYNDLLNDNGVEFIKVIKDIKNKIKQRLFEILYELQNNDFSNNEKLQYYLRGQLAAFNELLDDEDIDESYYDQIEKYL